MEYIAHRINTIAQLEKLPVQYGVELDLRDNLDGRIYISHNPFEPGGDFEEYLQHYHHQTMILNIKSERIEHKVLKLIGKYRIRDYFFLDSSFPMIYELSSQGEKHIALRYSEFEGLDTLYAMQKKVEWVWVDCFSKLPLTREIYRSIRQMGYKICLVSPELQGQNEKRKEYLNQIIRDNLMPDAVCTKDYCIDDWKKGFGDRGGEYA